MAVIIREKRPIAGKEMEVKVYKTSEPILSKEERERAEGLDKFLHEKMKQVEERLRKKGLLKLRGKKGVLKLWFELGKELRFVDDCQLVSEAHRRWLWRALYDHSPDLAPGPAGSRASIARNHFRYCYLLAKRFPNMDFVLSLGDWSWWIDLFDSPTIQNDERILEWISSKHQASELSRDELRKLINGIREEFPSMGMTADTTVLGKGELEQKLQQLYDRVLRIGKSQRRTMKGTMGV